MEEAYALDSKNFNVLKWCAIISGTCTEYLTAKDRIIEGHKFKVQAGEEGQGQKYLDEALSMKADESAFLHMRGRFAYEVLFLPSLGVAGDESVLVRAEDGVRLLFGSPAGEHGRGAVRLPRRLCLLRRRGDAGAQAGARLAGEPPLRGEDVHREESERRGGALPARGRQAEAAG